VVRASELPVSDPARKLIEAAPGLQLLPITGGDDYELLVSVAEGKAADFEAAARAAGCPVTRIGCIVKGAGVKVLDCTGREMTISTTGYDHFAS
jgi:thiamine-monophosphate kinase